MICFFLVFVLFSPLCAAHVVRCLYFSHLVAPRLSRHCHCIVFLQLFLLLFWYSNQKQEKKFIMRVIELKIFIKQWNCSILLLNSHTRSRSRSNKWHLLEQLNKVKHYFVRHVYISLFYACCAQKSSIVSKKQRKHTDGYCMRKKDFSAECNVQYNGPLAHPDNLKQDSLTSFR